MKKLFFLLAAMTAILTSCGSEDANVSFILTGFSEEQTPKVNALLTEVDKFVEPIAMEGYSRHPDGFAHIVNIDSLGVENNITFYDIMKSDLTYFSIMVAASNTNTKLDIDAVIGTAVVENDEYVIICNELNSENTLLYINDIESNQSLGFIYNPDALNNMIEIVANEIPGGYRELHAMVAFMSSVLNKTQDTYITSFNHCEDGINMRLTVPMKKN